MKTIKTVMHSYCFDTREPAAAKAYRELVAMLKCRGSECFETWGGGWHYDSFFRDGVPVELETSSLFDNQWNTAPIAGKSDKGLRVFDWAQDYPINFNKAIKRGHYLELTDEMRAVRRENLKCGYCGHMEPASSGLEFCSHCLDSAYLKSCDLHLLRLKSIDWQGTREPLSESEKAELLPRYREAQIKGSTERGKTRIAKARTDLENEREQAIRKAETKYNGFLWLMDHGINTENCIYYDHVNRFSFGWRNLVDDVFLSDLLDVIGEFPYPYEIKTADGRTLTGD